MRCLPLLALLVSGCLNVESQAVLCADGTTCPENTTCNATLHLCVTEAQQAACAGKADGDVCELTAAEEVCFEGVCVPQVCGDGLMGPGEACDDGNRDAGDGCSVKCDSLETCGNGVSDFSVGEACDDGNLVDHDGCSSGCQGETPIWSRHPLALSNRMRPSIAYDAGRDRVIVIGGLGNKIFPTGVYSVDLEDAWEWDGRWSETTYQPPPPAGFSFAMTYDAKHDRTLLYKGDVSNKDYGGELWSFDGTSWTRIWRQNIGDGPNVIAAAVAYDPIHDHLVVHGGFTYDGFSTVETPYTWIWNGTTGVWGKLAMDNSASGINKTRSDAAMAFDPKRGKIVMFGGSNALSGTLLGDLWELDDVTWSAPSAIGTPTARMAASLAWNSTCECLVLFGGATSNSTVTNQTYTWNGTTWANLTATSNPPPARSFAGLASDGHGRSLLVGGSRYVGGNSSDPNAYFEDTWTFDGSSWHEESLIRGAATALDLDRHRVIVYGGDIYASAGEGDPDTFEISENGMRRLANTTPPGAYNGPALAYDEARNETILLGGEAPGDGQNTSTWAWTGSSWVSRGALPVPLQNNYLPAAFDAARGEVIALGYAGCGDCPSTTWVWNGTVWTQKTTATAPPERVRAALGYDRTSGKVVLFGGTNYVTTYGDTWTWDGTTWTKIDGGTMAVPSEVRPYVAWDFARRKLVLVSGSYYEAWEWTGTWWSPLGTIGLHLSRNDAMVFSSLDGAGITVMGGFNAADAGDALDLKWTSVSGEDVCRRAYDGDGDGLAGCDDDDCWQVCTPACAPGDTCDPAAPSCGDGTCGPAESCRSCPVDCTTCNNVCGDGICDSGEACPGDCS